MLYNFNYGNKNIRNVPVAYSIKDNITIIPISYVYDIKNYISFYKGILPITKKEHPFKIKDYIREGKKKIDIDINKEILHLIRYKYGKSIYEKHKYAFARIHEEKSISNDRFIRLKRIKSYKGILQKDLYLHLKYRHSYKDLYGSTIKIIGTQTIKNVVYHKDIAIHRKNKQDETNYIYNNLFLASNENEHILSLNDFVSFNEFDRKSIKLNNSMLLNRSIIKNSNYDNVLATLNKIKERSCNIYFNPIEASLSAIDNLYINEHGRSVYAENRKLVIANVIKATTTISSKELDKVNFILINKRNNLNEMTINNIKELSKEYYKNQMHYDIKNKFLIDDTPKRVEYIRDKGIYLTVISRYILTKNTTNFFCRKINNIEEYSFPVKFRIGKQRIKIMPNSEWLNNTVEYFYEKDFHLKGERFKQVMFKTKTYEKLHKRYKNIDMVYDIKTLNKCSKHYKHYDKWLRFHISNKFIKEINNINFLNKQSKYINKYNKYYLSFHKAKKHYRIWNYDADAFKRINHRIFNTLTVGISKDKNIFKQHKNFVNINSYYNDLNIKNKEKSLFNITQQDKELSIINKDLFVSSCKILTINKALTIEQANELALSIEKDNDLFLFKIQDVFNYDKIANKLMLDTDFKEVYYEQSKKYKWLEGGEDDFEMKFDKYGIDELILPYNDYNYDNLKKTLISDEGKPLVPYKDLDKNSFIAKIPLQNPVPCFNDIGLEYIDVDVGILVHLLNTMYKLWRKKIFKFGAMDIKDSMECILSDLKDYIFLTFEGDDLKIASRVFRLFRWYAEMAMNKCCTYKVTLQYGPLYSNLDKGDCSIPYKLENMYIDENKYIITNSILNKECSCTFEIDNPVDTTVQATIYISNGSCDILLNDELNLTLTKGINNISIPLKRTDKSNILKIYYNSFNNGIIKISKVVISDMIYKDAKIEYYSKVGEGNFFMDLLTKNLKMTAITDIYDAEQIEKMKDNNLSISATLDRIKEYIELHHVNKIKGKRLTIKKS